MARATSPSDGAAAGRSALIGRAPEGSSTAALLVFLAGLLYAGGFGLLGYDAFHEGLIFVPARDVAHGETPYRGVFSIYGPLVILLQAGALKAFGDHLAVLRLLTALFYGLDAWLLCVVFSRLVPAAWAAAAVLAWLALAPFPYLQVIPWSSVYAIFFQVGALELALRGLRRSRWWLDVGSGVCVALAFLCRQSVGIFEAVALPGAVAALALFGTLEPRRAGAFGLRFAGGIALGGLPVLAYLAASGALSDFYLQYIYYLVFGWRWAPGTPGLADALGAIFPTSVFLDLAPATHVWLVLPALNVLVASWLLARGLRRRPVDVPLWLLAAVSVASWSQYAPVPDVRHCFWAAAPMLGIPAFLLRRQWERGPMGLRFVVPLCLVLLVLGLEVGSRVRGFQLVRSGSYVAMQSPSALAGLWLETPRAREVLRLTELVNDVRLDHPELPVIIRHRHSVYHAFFPWRENFHKLEHVYFPKMYNDLYPGYEDAISVALAEGAVVLAPPDETIPSYRKVAEYETLHLSVRLPREIAQGSRFPDRARH